jgi:septin family protein
MANPIDNRDATLKFKQVAKTLTDTSQTRASLNTKIVNIEAQLFETPGGGDLLVEDGDWSDIKAFLSAASDAIEQLN